MLKYSPLFESRKGPTIISPASGRHSLLDAIVPEMPHYRQELNERGAILLRGFDVSEVKHFDAFVEGISQQQYRYVYRSTPRTEITNRVSTATNYPARLEIPMHNESAYHTTWPLLVAFCCIEAPAEGGQTPIAPMREITRNIGSDLLERLEEKGVEYIRHYHPNIDLPWQTVFQTENRSQVDEYCASSGIASHWGADGLLRTANRAQGTALHPVTSEKIVFNQAHLFHVSSLGRTQAQAMMNMFGADKLPRHARFGDGTEISEHDLQRIQQAFSSEALVFHWQPGDVLLLDNMTFAHGRKPYKGSRAVFAALMEPSR
jgi:alpha-ketoglutarate-dependent taurine dioxygenase